MNPVALFVYNRPYHARKVINSLLCNKEALNSHVFVFCDGPRTEADVELVEKTRSIVHDLAPPNFDIIERETNYGLAKSIISGVTKLCKEYGSAIIIEDDLVLSSSALEYFNSALDYYRDDPRVMHVSGYMYPVRDKLPSSFFYREATCWGWATWARAWEQFQPDPKIIMNFVKENNLYKEFNIRNTMLFWEMLAQHSAGRIDSWAIRWYGSMFMAGGLALHPAKSLVENKGFDGTGVHCRSTSKFDVQMTDELPTFSRKIEESNAALTAMMNYRKSSIFIPFLLKRFAHKLYNDIKALRSSVLSQK
jgi:hypothetical protein